MRRTCSSETSPPEGTRGSSRRAIARTSGSARGSTSAGTCDPSTTGSSGSGRSRRGRARGGEGRGRVRPRDGPRRPDRQGQRPPRRGRGRPRHGDERGRDQRIHDLRADRGGRLRGPRPLRDAPRRVRAPVARGRRRPPRGGGADQGPRGPVLRERPAPRGRDAPPRPEADGARNPLPADLPRPPRQSLIGTRRFGADSMDIRFLGGASEVGRLGMILKDGPTSLLLDYGILPRDPPIYPLPAPPVDAMFVTHAHLDTSGMLPWVTRRQDVDVVMTPPTADVADLLLADSLKIADAEGFDAPFDDSDLRTARRRLRTVDVRDNMPMGALE